MNSAPPTLASFAVLQRLRALVDTRLGTAPRSERPAPIGTLVVGVKRGFRRAAQPFINEIMNRQARFNEELLEWGRALTRDVESLERSMMALRSSLDLRLARLEALAARVEELERRQTQDAGHRRPRDKAPEAV
jgi:hypothetical protein